MKGYERMMNYRGHVIYRCKITGVFEVALKKDGTDNYYPTFEQAMEAVDAIEDNK